MMGRGNFVDSEGNIINPVWKGQIEEGVRMYVAYVKQNKKGSAPLQSFFHSFDPEIGRVITAKENGGSGFRGPLKKILQRFQYIHGIPHDVDVEEWVRRQISADLRNELDDVTRKYVKHTLDEGVLLYINHLRQYKDESSPINFFFLTYDSSRHKIIKPGDNSGKIYRGLLARFDAAYRADMQEIGQDTTFMEWVRMQISDRLKEELDGLVGKYLSRSYSLEEGVDRYIAHMKANGIQSADLTHFFVRFDVESGEVRKGSRSTNQKSKLYRHCQRFHRQQKAGSVDDFADYLIDELPEEKRVEAAYYLKGQYLEDLRKARVDPERLKGALLDG